jgi:hypothetical protein
VLEVLLREGILSQVTNAHVDAAATWWRAEP